jgi:tetraacyldisaccharide 4'-kinase
MLAPLALAYGAVAQARLNRIGERASVPVICIGNLTVGGAGKTPAALAVAQMLAAAGERPAFLSRGYGGTSTGPLQVDAVRHRAAEVGDEPLLLARSAPTIVARVRPEGARIAAAAGASVVIMDDGFQNPSLAKDFSVLVVDARRGIGNGHVLPAGPLRAPLDAQLRQAQAMILITTSPVRSTPISGAEAALSEPAGLSARASRAAAECGLDPSGVLTAARSRNIPLFRARFKPDAQLIAELDGAGVFAFAGIGDPQKFFATLAGAGIAVAVTRSFPDHHRYTRREAQALCDEAAREGLLLLTTEKDFARLTGEHELAQLAAAARPFPVSLALEEERLFMLLMQEQIAEARELRA